MKRKVGIILFVVIILVGILILLINNVHKELQKEIKIFDSIQEFENIEIEGSTIQTLDSKTDRYLKDLFYKEYFGASYQIENDDVILYAYIFHDKDSAKSYFENVTGQKTSLNADFSKSITISRIVVLEDCKIYYVYSKDIKTLNKFLDILNKNLTVSLLNSSD